MLQVSCLKKIEKAVLFPIFIIRTIYAAFQSCDAKAVLRLLTKKIRVCLLISNVFGQETQY